MGVQRVLLDGQRTWTVTGDDHLPAGPVEEYLEFLRVAQQASPNTVRSYATSLARWWEYLTTAGTACLAAASISALVAPGRPSSMLRRMVSLNNKVYCVTTAI